MFRIAKLSDLQQITDLDYKVRIANSPGYFTMMGKSFLKEYYRIVLNDPYEVIICAEDLDGNLLGFNSASLDVKRQFIRMRKKKWRMVLASLPSFIKHPSLIKMTFQRYNATAGSHDKRYIPEEGARGEYWVWDPEKPNGLLNAGLYSAFLKILYNLGVNILQFEVDADNETVLSFVKRNKAYEVEKVTLQDGRERYLMEYNLKEKYSKTK